MKLAWVTDIHLNFLDPSERTRFCDRIKETQPDGVLVGGDIAKATTFESELRRMERRIQKPIWFVLGNHDFYGGSVAGVRERAAALSRIGRTVWLGAR